MTPFTSIDLNLLVAFDALIAERSVSRAAQRLSLSQPALSHALRRLRDIFEDDLLVRGPLGMVPTDKALELHPGIAEGLRTLRITVEGPEVFNPATAVRTFKLAMTDAVAISVLPGLISRLRRAAPGVDLTIVNCGAKDGADRILAGEIELGVGVYPTLSSGLVSTVFSPGATLFCVVDRTNPRLKDGRLSLEDYLALPHVVVSVNHDQGVVVDEAIEAMGLKRRVVANVAHFTAVPAIIRGTDLVGHCGPKVLENLTYRDEFAVFPPPIITPAVDLCGVWRRSSTRDQGLTWLTSVVRAVAEQDVNWGVDRPIS